jgi:hypothetical protein
MRAGRAFCQLRQCRITAPFVSTDLIGFQEALEGVAGRPLKGQHVGVILIPDPLKRPKRHHPVFGHYLLTQFAQSIVRGRHKIPRPRYPSTADTSSQSLAESDILTTSQLPETLLPHWALPSALYHHQPNSVHTPHHPPSKSSHPSFGHFFGLVRRAWHSLDGEQDSKN